MTARMASIDPPDGERNLPYPLQMAALVIGVLGFLCGLFGLQVDPPSHMGEWAIVAPLPAIGTSCWAVGFRSLNPPTVCAVAMWWAPCTCLTALAWGLVSEEQFQAAARWSVSIVAHGAGLLVLRRRRALGSPFPLVESLVMGVSFLVGASLLTFGGVFLTLTFMDHLV